MHKKKITLSLSIILIILILVTLFLWQKRTEPFIGASALFMDIRQGLQQDADSFIPSARLPHDYVEGKSQLYLTLYQPGLKPLRWGTIRSSLSNTLKRNIAKLQKARTFPEFNLQDMDKSRILLEYITKRQPVDQVGLLSTSRLDEYRFEPGITGLSFHYKGQKYYYMPTEAFSRSHMSLNQVYHYLARRVGIKGKKRQSRIGRFKRNVTQVELIESRAFVSYKDRVIELYRGYPKNFPTHKQAMQQSLLNSADWVMQNMDKQGNFLYYYDAARDNTADFQHPKNPHYYNILRHSGGTITLLRAYELSGDSKYLAAARHSLDYMLTKSRLEPFSPSESDTEKSRYVFYNKKAKLGGTGIALVALMQYWHLSGDDHYHVQARQMTNHLLSRIADDGEFIGYYIHPLYQDGKPLINVTPAERKKLFSFYYPGEALLGLALYEKHVPKDDSFNQTIREKSIQALDFLVHERPKKYPELFLALPADSWLMQAIEEWWDHPQMQDPAYSRFVFEDAMKMIEHSYNETNSPYPDYKGHFYYQYGDHALPDGARAEGLIAATYLARKAGEEILADYFLQKSTDIAKALMQTYNSPEALYAAPAPEKAVGAFRFKLTRQWLRVDSVQHTACFLARLTPLLE